MAGLFRGQSRVKKGGGVRDDGLTTVASWRPEQDRTDVESVELVGDYKPASIRGDKVSFIARMIFSSPLSLINDS